MGGLDSCRWLLEVISFCLVPNLTDLEKGVFGGTCRFGPKNWQTGLNGGLDSCRWLFEVISFSFVPNWTDLEKCDFGGTCRFGPKNWQTALNGV